MDKSNIEIKKDNFRTEIRKRQINSYFQIKRNEAFSRRVNQHQQQLAQLLSTEQKKKEYIQNIAVSLIGYPQPQWDLSLKKLQFSVRAFEGSFQLWYELGVIKWLTQLLKQEYTQLNLSSGAAAILSDIFYESHENKNFIAKILQYEFLEDLLEACREKKRVATNYFGLIKQIISQNYKLRDLMVDKGLVQIMVERFSEPMLEYDEFQVEEAFQLILRLVKVYEKDMNYKYPKNNVLIVFLNFYQNQLNYNLSEQVQSLIAIGIKEILANEKQIVFRLSFKSVRILNFLFFHAANPVAPETRRLALQSFGLLTYSENIDSIKELVHRNILDKLYEACKVVQKTEEIIAICIIMVNICDNSSEDTQKIVNHPIFGEFLLEQVHSSKPIKIQIEAYYCLVTIIQKKMFIINEMLIKKYQCLEILVLGLSVKDANLIYEVLKGLKSLILFYQNVYYEKKGNKVIDMLERFYNFSNILTEMHENTMNSHIASRCSELLDLINDQS